MFFLMSSPFKNTLISLLRASTTGAGALPQEYAKWDRQELSAYAEPNRRTGRKTFGLRDQLAREMPVNIQIRQLKILQVVRTPEEQRLPVSHALCIGRFSTPGGQPSLLEVDCKRSVCVGDQLTVVERLDVRRYFQGLACAWFEHQDTRLPVFL